MSSLILFYWSEIESFVRVAVRTNFLACSWRLSCPNSESLASSFVVSRIASACHMSTISLALGIHIRIYNFPRFLYLCDHHLPASSSTVSSASPVLSCWCDCRDIDTPLRHSVVAASQNKLSNHQVPCCLASCDSTTTTANHLSLNADTVTLIWLVRFNQYDLIITR